MAQCTSCLDLCVWCILLLYVHTQRQANDPNRFTNRGGQLQKQLKLRKQLEKELPRTERELKSVLTQWEEDHERHFIVHDARFLDLLEQQVEERCQKKEVEKLKKVQLT